MAVVSITSPIMHNFRILFLRFYRPLDSFLSIRLFRLRRLAVNSQNCAGFALFGLPRGLIT
jgi:hypothetical protein